MAVNGISSSEKINERVLSQDEIYKLGLTFFKEQEGRSFHVNYQDKLSLIALTQQAHHGPITEAKLAPLGIFDVIGKERRGAWSRLGSMSKESAKQSFINQMYKLAPGFLNYVKEYEAVELKKERERSCLQADPTFPDTKNKIWVCLQTKESAVLEDDTDDKEECAENSEKLVEEGQRRAIQDSLNKTTFQQFKTYAEQQYPGNPDQQAVLIKQLQEQHYYQYMQQVIQQQEALSNQLEMKTMASNQDVVQEDEKQEEESALLTNDTDLDEEEKTDESECHEHTVDKYRCRDTEEDQGQDYNEPEDAAMWTRRDMHEFKEMIRKEEADAIIKVGHGETVTIRVPTHEDGRSLYWEFATDSYDIGFGVFFEWVDPEDSQVTVHISDSEDDDEFISDEEHVDDGDAEIGSRSILAENGPPTSCIVPIYRRDCHEEVYAGSHTYPRQGIYLLKFDNSYSLWRAKTLYYRVYYTR